ncbi:MAG: immunoglobulin-like domain-containing protein [Bacilli bacterium]
MLKKTAKFMLMVFILNLMMPLMVVLGLNNLGISNTNKCSNKQYEVVMINSSKNITHIACYNNYNDAKVKMNAQVSTLSNVASVVYNKTIIDSSYALLNLDTKASNLNTNLREEKGPSYINGYTNGYYGVDAPMLDYYEYKGGTYAPYTTAELMISGYRGWVRKSDGGNCYNVVPLSLVINPTYYHVNTNNDLVHNISKSIIKNKGYSSLVIGPAPKFLEKNKKYYSYDGHYFYTSLLTMIDDYKAKKYNQAVNNEPYYNYYLYLPHRTKTNHDAADINAFIKNKGKLSNMGQSFIDAQNKFGVNAILSLGVSINESGWGSSPIAQNKNNLFGHGAYDYDPAPNANSYANPTSSINYHADRFISAGYSNPLDWRYFGSHLGNKLSGINVKYASDPYWSEKAVQYYYSFEKATGLIDYDYYKIGIKDTNPKGASLAVRKEPTINGPVLYQMKNSSFGIEEMPVVILDTVTGDKVNGNNVWYKIQTDAYLNSSRDYVQDVPKNHTYHFDKNYGYVHSSYIYLITHSKLKITASNKTVLEGKEFNPFDEVKAYNENNQDITDKLIVESGEVNTSKPGEYVLIYYVEDNDQELRKKVIITVRSNTPPIIEASNKEHLQYESFNPLDEVKASDQEDGNLTKKIKVITNEVNIKEQGTYIVKYEVSDSDNNKVTKEIQVTVVKNNKPVIFAEDKIINNGLSFNPKTNIEAYDSNDGDITNKITVIGRVDSSISGVYPLTYQVVNSQGFKTIKTIEVTVKGSVKKALGNFYLHSLNWKNNKMEIEGYLTIEGSNNVMSQNIIYDLIFQEVDKKKTYSLPLERWGQTKTYPLTAPSYGGFNYADSWFKGSLDLSVLPEGDYLVYVKARMNGRETTALLKNIFSRQIIRKASDKDNRGYLFRSNYYLKEMPLEVFIRDQGLITKTEPPTPFDNMFNSYQRLELINQNNKILLDLRGYSFNVKGDYSKKSNVTRELIFENIKTFERYTKNLGYVDNANVGLSKISLRVPDGLDKTRAWFDNKIDLTDLKEGTYAIFIRSKTGKVDDYGELYDITFRNFNKTITSNKKKYTIKLNPDKRARIELIVEG